MTRLLKNIAFIVISVVVVLLPSIHSTPVSSSPKKSPQGILEIPKVVATVIRNTLENHLSMRLNLSHIFATQPPSAAAYDPQAIHKVTIQPLAIFVDKTKTTEAPPPEPETETEPPRTSPSPPPSPETTTPKVIIYRTNKPTRNYSRPRATAVPPVTADTADYDDELTTTEYIKVNIINSRRNRTARTTTKRPGTYTFVELDPPQAVVSRTPGTGEVYWSEDQTRPSLVIPIQSTSTTTEEPVPPPPSTTEEDGEEETDVDEARKRRE